jgi:predicted O-methyltransferase YrrM
MESPQWTAVDNYITDLLVPPDPLLDAILAESTTAGLPPIAVSPNLGKLLHLLARLVPARRVLEIGTLAGYSTIWLARALPEGGQVVTLEADPRHAEIARANFARAGLSQVIDLRLGRALDTLPQIAAERQPPFDLIFIDADKVNTSEYFDWALRFSRTGTLIVVDNVVRSGAVADPKTADANVQGMRRFFVRLASERRVDATAMQTVGSKGYDGLAVALVKDPAGESGR